MSREIKFRFWDEYNKQYSEEPFYRITISNDGQVYNSENDEWYEVNTRYVIQQFTGLKDKKGKEIYEGDIIKCKPIDVIHPQDLFKYNNFEFLTSAVYWSKEYCCFETDFNSSCFADSKNVIEVIGNIYETPELLQS